MKRKYLIRAIWILTAVLLLACGSAVGLMFRETEQLHNQLVPAFVDCVVYEDSNFTEGIRYTDTKESIKVQNTGNIDAYIRLRLVTYWVNDEGKIVARPSKKLEISISEYWIAGTDGAYYHKDPVIPDAFTKELLAKPISLEISEEGYYQVIEVFADAIQSRPETTVTEKWGVAITDGEIQSGG